MESYAPQITDTEVKDWEDKFRQQVSPMVKFNIDDTGFSMKLYKGDSGIEAVWSGTIILESENYIKWSFSLQKDVFVDAKLTLTEDNYMIIPNMFTFSEDWKEYWSKALTMQNVNIKPGQDEPLPMTPDVSSQNKPATAKPNPAITEGFMLRKMVKSNDNKPERTKESIIKEHSLRMRKLAGL